MTGHGDLEAGTFDAAYLEDLARLHAMCFAQAWPASEFGRLTATPGTFSLIARANANAVGFLLGRVASDEAEIISIGVAPEHRRQGIAARLLTGAGTHLRVCGALSLFIEVDQDNQAAIGLYAKHGFERVARRPGYYNLPDGTRSDAVVMRRRLTDA